MFQADTRLSSAFNNCARAIFGPSQTKSVVSCSRMNAALFMAATLFLDSLVMAAKARSNLDCLHESSSHVRSSTAEQAAPVWRFGQK
jgi:hypothetical protein